MLYNKKNLTATILDSLGLVKSKFEGVATLKKKGFRLKSGVSLRYFKILLT